MYIVFDWEMRICFYFGQAKTVGVQALSIDWLNSAHINLWLFEFRENLESDCAKFRENPDAEDEEEEAEEEKAESDAEDAETEVIISGGT